jgi:hypothetical protein
MVGRLARTRGILRVCSVAKERLMGPIGTHSVKKRGHEEHNAGIMRSAVALRKLFEDAGINIKVKVSPKVCPTGTRIC